MITAIFDLDGTLADTLCDLADATNYGLRQLGYPEHPYESYKYFVGNGVQKLCFRALPEDKKSETDKLLEIFREYYSAHFLDKTKLYPGIWEALQALSQRGVKLAIATNKPEEFAVQIAEKLLSEFNFVKVLGGCSYRPKKPDTAILVEIFAALPDEENRVFMIGDSAVDIKLGQNAGVETIGCTWGFRGRQELEEAGADHIAETADDIVQYVSLTDQ